MTDSEQSSIVHATTKGHPHKTRFERVISFMQNNLSEPITLAEMADVAALSSHHFNRSFKRAMGATPGRYLRALRINRAKELLTETAEPISSIAVACGFCSNSHMAQAFKQSGEISPCEYRAGVISQREKS